jgi:hypothetical protein
MDSSSAYLIYIVLFFAISVFFMKSAREYFALYRKKKNPKYPILPNEAAQYLDEDFMNFLRVFPLIPLFMWKIIFESHNDKQLNYLARRTRNLFFLLILEMVGGFFIIAFIP